MADRVILRQLLFALLLVFTLAAVESRKLDETPPCSEVISYFIHERFTGSNATLAIVLPPVSNVTEFGQFGIVDDELRKGPSNESELIGRARGTAAFDSLNDGTFLQSTTVEFQGRNGTILIQGQNNLVKPERELAIVGGTGEFRRVQGYAITRTVSLGADSFVGSYELHLFRLWGCTQK